MSGIGHRSPPHAWVCVGKCRSGGSQAPGRCAPYRRNRGALSLTKWDKTLEVTVEGGDTDKRSSCHRSRFRAVFYKPAGQAGASPKGAHKDRRLPAANRRLESCQRQGARAGVDRLNPVIMVDCKLTNSRIWWTKIGRACGNVNVVGALRGYRDLPHSCSDCQTVLGRCRETCLSLAQGCSALVTCANRRRHAEGRGGQK